MAICIHGDVCQRWMKQMNCCTPLVPSCPYGCVHFESKTDVQDAILGERTIDKLCDIVMELAKKRGDCND